MKIIFTILFFSISLYFGYAQNIPRFYHLTREEGLSQSTVNFILQDYDKFFWFCTDDGVNKWNGYDFKHYTYKENNPNSLALGRASVILQDEDSVIWVGSRQGGISKYIKEYDHFIVYQIEKGLYTQNRTGFNYITSMIPFMGNLLVGTLDNGLHYFNKKTEKFTLIKLQLKNGNEIPSPIEFRLFASKDESYWLAHSNGVLRVIDIKKNQDNFTFVVEAFIEDMNTISIYEDHEGMIWFGTLESGALCYNPDSDEKRWLTFGKGDGNHLNNAIVRCFGEDNVGNLWIGTAGGGINVYNYKSGEISYLLPQIGNKYTIGSNSIYYIYQSPDSNMWVGTFNGGVSYTNRYKQSFNHVKSFGAAGDLNNNSILSFCETPDGEIWLGTDGGGINVLDPATSRHTSLKFLDKDIIKVAKSLTTDRSGNIYIGTYREGLYIYNYKSGRLQNFNTTTPVKLSNPDIWDMALSKNEKILWMSTLGEGLIRHDLSNNDLQFYRNNADSIQSISHNYLSTIFVDSKDNVWTGSFNAGISLLPNGKGGDFINFRADSVSNISSNEIYSIYEDSRGNILVGTHEGGLNVFKKETNKFVIYRNDDVILGSTVQGIIEDNDGFVWVSTDVGLSKLKVYSADSITLIKHFPREGLLANEFNQHATFKSSEGRLFFGGVNGYNSFIPRDIPVIESVGKTIITNVSIFDQKLETDIITKGKRNNEKGIVLEPWQTTLSFEFAMLDYTLPELNTYEYKLEDFDKEWISSGNRRRATYTNIDPGTYTFHVRGINSQGIKNLKSESITFTIMRPYYKTTIFKILLISLVLFLIFLAYRIRLKTYIRQEELLKKMVGERTSELLSLNKVLEKQNEEINHQSKELRIQQSKLMEANKELQNSYKKIEKQNVELEKHRNNLEEIVKKRTEELELAKSKAEESERLKMAFLSNMSHEIRTPMNAIVGFASLLADEDLTPEERSEFIKQVNINGNSLLILIDDILDLSKIEANQLKVKNEVFELNVFVGEVFFNWQRLHNRKQTDVKIAFNNKIDSKHVYIQSDAVRILQIINNLLDNALKFTHKGEIILTLDIENEYITISVKDTGIGISPEFQPLIFNRFRKAEETDGKLYRGAGLGLTISNRLANMLGGSLEVNSQKNVGSIFRLKLPTSIITNEMAIKSKISDAEPKTIKIPSLKILVAEDEDTNFIYLKSILERWKCSIDRAKDGEEAIQLFSRNRYDLVLMDIKMPVLNGIDATKNIKQKVPDQIIFALTAYARIEEEQQFKLAGFDEYLTKPIKKEVLLETIQRYF